MKRRKKKMRKNKIGAIFLVSTLALAGLGLSYAGFYDDIYVYGYVSTATVEFEVVDYSGTWVFKIWCFSPDEDIPAPEFPGWIVTWIPEEETLILRGFGWPDYDALDAWVDEYGLCYELAAYAYAYPGMYEDEVGMYWWQVFPCINFTADVIIHYLGCIPAHITIEDFWFNGSSDLFQYISFQFFEYYPIYNATGVIVGWDRGAQIVVWPVQMHWCQYIGVIVNIKIPQDNSLQGLFGYFGFRIHALQWNELCPDPPEV
jgi:hypothetical protein